MLIFDTFENVHLKCGHPLFQISEYRYATAKRGSKHPSHITGTIEYPFLDFL